MSTTMEVQPVTEIREGDVYSFSYSEAYRAKARGDLHWCFDAQLVAINGVLCDTYWMTSLGQRHGDLRTFTLAEANARGTLRFVCNLNDVDMLHGEQEAKYYEPSDVFNLTHHHGYRQAFAKRKGAERSQRVMLEEVERVMREVRDDAESAVRRASYDIEWLTKARVRIESGDTSGYIISRK